MKPLPPASATACERAEDERVVRARERHPVDDHQLAGRPGHVDALPQRQRAEQRGRGVAGEVADQGRGLVLALQQHRGVEPVAHRLGCGARSAHRAEQAQRPASGRPDQRLELVQLGRPDAVATRRRQVLRDVQDGLSRVVERAADVEPGPLRGVRAGQPQRAGQGLEGAARARASPRSGPPSARRRAARAAGRPPRSARRAAPCRGAARRPARSTSWSWPVSSRSLTSKTSCTPARATCRAPSTCSPAGGLSAVSRARAASRTRARAASRPAGTSTSRPSARSSSAAASSSAAVDQRLVRLGQTLGRLAAHQLGRLPRRPLHRGRRELVGDGRGHPVDQLVPLVDDHHVVLGQQGRVAEGVDGEQRVVGHHDVGRPWSRPGPSRRSTPGPAGTSSPGTRGPRPTPAARPAR